MGKASRRKRQPLDTLDGFTRVAAHECAILDRDTYESLVLFGHTKEVLCLGIEHGEPEESVAAKTDQVFASRPRYAGMAIRTRWSPDQVTDFEDAWALVTVENGDASARLTIVWQPGPDATYHRVEMLHAPWVVASTAGSLRAALAGEPLTFRRGSDRRLWNKIFEEPPPTHPDGKI